MRQLPGGTARGSGRGAAGAGAAATLWQQAGQLDPRMLAYTIADDRDWDARLLRWDVLGSLGHVEGLRASGLISAAEHRRMQRALRAALRAVEAGELAIGTEHEDVHSAVEFWVTARAGTAGERIHTGRSRNDQVTVDLRLYLKHRALSLAEEAEGLVAALLAFAAAHRTALWPGYTHLRRAMPSSGALWAAGYAEGILDTLEELPALWRQLDRSPLGSAAGYGVPLPLRREATARALGFGALNQVVTSVQNGRGKVEGAVLFWCAQFAHELGRLSSDVILYSAEEFGWLVLPAAFATGSSIMPQKRNPDLFELTRARAAQVEGELAHLLALRAKLTGGYHRDFQFLKAPLMRGLDATEAMLGMLAHVLPHLGVDRARGAAALTSGVLATDEALRRARAGEPFRRAYRDVADAVKRGEAMPALPAAEIAASRRSTGGLGNPGLGALRARLRASARWRVATARRFTAAMARLAGARVVR